MQLKRKVSTSIGASLAAATAGLLGQTPGRAIAQELTPWEYDTAILYYGESDSRVRDVSLNLNARKEVREEGFLNLKLAIDTLTGASPSGAVPANAVQTFTTPSGGSSFTMRKCPFAPKRRMTFEV